MKAVFVRPDDPATPVGSAEWTNEGPRVETDDHDVAAALARVFQQSPVVVDDPSLRVFGSAGPAVLQPGSVRWFRAAAATRGAREGLEVRFVADDAEPAAWDPAGAYRTFADADDGRA
jgi:hypothetical protein